MLHLPILAKGNLTTATAHFNRFDFQRIAFKIAG